MTTSHPTKFSESLILGATQAGNSETLARFVLDDLASKRTVGKLLYLTGDKNKDTFQRTMSENGVTAMELMVYETKAARDLEERIARTVQEIINGEACGVFLLLKLLRPFIFSRTEQVDDVADFLRAIIFGFRIAFSPPTLSVFPSYISQFFSGLKANSQDRSDWWNYGHISSHRARPSR